MAKGGAEGVVVSVHHVENVSLQNFSESGAKSKKRPALEIGETDGDGRGPSHVGTGTQWGAWALTHNAQNHLEALFSIGLNCRGASKEIVKGKYLEPSSMSKPPSRTG